MGGQDRAVLALAQAFLSAPVEADGWDRALKLFAKATRSSRANLVEISPGQFVYNWVTDAPSDFYMLSDEIGAGDPTINWRIASTLDLMQVSYEHHYRETQERMSLPSTRTMRSTWTRRSGARRSFPSPRPRSRESPCCGHARTA